jgi:hypothetical protein
VIEDGLVISTLDVFWTARAVTVVTSSGRRCAVTGVAGFSHENLVLLAVDWRGVEPRHFHRVRELPAPGSILHVRRGPGFGDIKEASWKIGALEPQETELEILCEKPMSPGYPGSPVVDDQGRMVGVVKGFNVSFTFHMGDVPVFPTSALRVARPEIVDAVGAESPIPWEEWTTVIVPRIAESRRVLEREEKAMRAGKYAEVIDLGHEAVRLDERNAEAWYWLGGALEETKEPEGALHALARAAALMPLSAAAWDGKAHALYDLRRFPECLMAATRAHELDPKNAEYGVTHALALEVNGRLEEAATEFRACLPRLEGEQAEWARERLKEVERELGVRGGW